MKSSSLSVKKRLIQHSTKKRKIGSASFFKTGKGQYGEGDVFIGVSVPDIRKVAKEFRELDLNELKKLLQSKVHEERLLALIILVKQFEIASRKNAHNDRERIYKFYLTNLKYVNNWDLVDTSAHKIIGAVLADKKDRKILYKLAKSKNIWERRVAIVTTYWFIRKGEYIDTFRISEILLYDNEDLIHKAVGWMLREVGNRSQKTLEKFLKKHASKMPRTMLRYAIEKFPDRKRKQYLKA